MATKNIARSALEGGRHNFNKWDRRNSHAEERAEVRDYCKRLVTDPEYADEDFIDDIRPVYKEFTDKLRPMQRWLAKQVGRKWADVRSEVAEKFDTRTTAGRHITYDHLLREVVDTESGFDKYGGMMNPNVELAKNKEGYSRGGHSNYYVDEHGVLCENPNSYKNSRRSYKWESISEEEYKIAGEWLHGSMISEKGGKFTWLVPTDGIWKASWDDSTGYAYSAELKYYLFDNGPYKQIYKIPMVYAPGFRTEKINRTGLHWEHIENPFSFRQRGELTASELKVFKSFKRKIKKDILNASVGR